MKRVPKWVEANVRGILESAGYHANSTQRAIDCDACVTFAQGVLLAAYKRGKRAGERKRKKR